MPAGVGLDDADSLLPPEVIAAETVEDLQAVLAELATVAEALQAAADRRSSAEASAIDG